MNLNGVQTLRKTPTMIPGLDDVLCGGLPEGRTTLIGGGPGSGKSVLALEFLYHGAIAGKPGIFVTFEERVEAVRENARTLGWDLPALEEAGRLFVLDARMDPETVVSGEFNLKGLLAIINGKARAMGATRVVFDALDVLMRFFGDVSRERNELYSLNDWLLENNLTGILTVKASEGNMVTARYEFLEFMADCVIWLSQRPTEQVSTRELQVVKYRGSGFGRNRYPFVITDCGMNIIPISTCGLQHKALGPYVSSGLDRFDRLLGGGFRRASSILIAGATGTGKTTLACTFVAAACKRGEKALYLGYEESPEAMAAGMRSAGIELTPAMENGNLRVITAMPEAMGTEEHLLGAFRIMEEFKPDHVIVDAISSCKRMGSERAAFEYTLRLVTACKERGITAILTSQSEGFLNTDEISGLGISSVIDALVFLRYIYFGGEVNRTIMIMKSRGSRHSNQAREFSITDNGIELLDVYLGEGGALTGTARQEQEAEERLSRMRREQEIMRRENEISQKRAILEAETARLRAEIELANAELEGLRLEESVKQNGLVQRATSRSADVKAEGPAISQSGKRNRVGGRVRNEGS